MFERLLVLLAVLLLGSAAPGAAEQDNTMAEVSVLPGWQMPNGNRMIGVQVRLAPGWKTYWRSPAGNGIPPQFDWSDSRNLRGGEVYWPAPIVFETYGTRAAGYEDEVIYPIELTPEDPSEPIALDIAMIFGVCEEICIPTEAQVRVDIAPGETGGKQRIAAAYRSRDIEAAEVGVTHGCEIRPEGKGFGLTARIRFPEVPAMPKMVVFETRADDIWIAARRVETEGHAMTLDAELSYYGTGPFAFDRSGMAITLLGNGRAVRLSGCPAG